MSSDLFERGLALRREVMGAESTPLADPKRNPIKAEFQDLVVRYTWGEIWARPGLERKIRSCITLAMLVALNHPTELAIHMRAALRIGVTKEELLEVLLQTVIYCGAPAAENAVRVAEEVLAESRG